LSTTPLKKTNPKLTVSTTDNDVSYYFSYRAAEARYEKAAFRWEKYRYAELEKKRKALERCVASRSRRSSGPGDMRLTSASAVKHGAVPQEVSRDPRAWFNSKIAGSFGSRPSQKSAAVGQTGTKIENSTQLKSSVSLLDGTAPEEAVETPVKKEGLWSKLLRVLGLKK
jgi:hypothetical protein